MTKQRGARHERQGMGEKQGAPGPPRTAAAEGGAEKEDAAESEAEDGEEREKPLLEHLHPVHGEVLRDGGNGGRGGAPYLRGGGQGRIGEIRVHAPAEKRLAHGEQLLHT